MFTVYGDFRLIAMVFCDIYKILFLNEFIIFPKLYQSASDAFYQRTASFYRC